MTKGRKVVIIAKVDASERSRVERVAREEGISISAVVRRALLRDSRRTVNSTNVATTQEVK